jgi:hypothetical protein
VEAVICANPVNGLEHVVWEVEDVEKKGGECLCDKIFGLSGLQLAEAAA